MYIFIYILRTIIRPSVYLYDACVRVCVLDEYFRHPVEIKHC